MKDRTPEEHNLSYDAYLRTRGLHPEQLAQKKAKAVAKRKVARKARKVNRKR